MALKTAVEFARELKAGFYGLRVVNHVPPRVPGTAYVPMDIKVFNVPMSKQDCQPR